MLTIYMVFNLSLVLVAILLISKPHVSIDLRLIFSIFLIGGVANIAGILWFGYANVYPGEAVITVAALLLLIWLALKWKKLFGLESQIKKR